jgi:hypothetical protein
VSKGYTSKPWRIIPGTGQSLALTSGNSVSFANAVGTETYAVAFRLAPTATAYIATVTVSHAGGTPATATTDYPVASSDYPQIIGVSPGDKLSVYQASGSTGTAYMCELT